MCVEKPLLLKNALRNQVAAHMQTAFIFHHWIVIALVSMDTECKEVKMNVVLIQNG